MVFLKCKFGINSRVVHFPDTAEKNCMINFIINYGVTKNKFEFILPRFELA